MASHEELVAELTKLEKLSHAARLKHAKKRRQKQLKKYQEFLRYDRQTSGTITKKRNAPKISFEKSSVLTDLVSRNDLIGVSKLLENGADPNISNADGLTPLHKCCIDNAQEMAEVILEHDVDLNARDIEGWSALHAAAATGNVQMINLLVDEGASLVAINNDDKMPVDVAADGDIRYILQQKMLEAGYTEDVLEYIRVSVPKTMLADIKDSVRNNRCLNIQDKYGTSALHIAASNGYTEVLNYLLSQEGVELDIADNEGWTPFHAAVCWNQPDAMKKLAEKGANMDLKNSRGETPFVIAEDPEVRQLILELKGEYGESQDIMASMDEEEMPHIPRARRMSVKRISQQAKEELAKQSVQEETSLRRESMAQHDMQMSMSDKVPGGSKTQALADVIAGAEEDDELTTMVRMKSFSVASEASKDTSSLNSATPTPEEAKEAETSLRSVEGESNPLISSKESTPGEDPAPSAVKTSESKGRRISSDGGAGPSRTFNQNAPFHKSRVPRKSVLKHVNHPIARVPSTYDSTTAHTSPPSSPSSTSGTGSPIDVVTRSPVQDNKKPCCVVM